MTRVLLSVATLSLALMGCGGEGSSTGATSGGATSTSGSAGGATSSASATSSTGATAPMDHTITVNAKFVVDDSGQVPFTTPQLNVTKTTPESIVGKYYLFSIYKGGFAAGTDLPIDGGWGKIPESLTLSLTTPTKYKDGIYDVVLVMYRSTEITPEIMSKPASQAPQLHNGDLSIFRLDTSNVHMGDPVPPAGIIRVNMEGADVSLSFENRWPEDPSNKMELADALNDTILYIP